ncbi:MAG: type I-E CRISPR-associated endoribonuclease Cas2e [Micrococcales bacterium]|nr:type I-E CRISPR-associated endoribonuclease Cas2e [Micrococcales bacterium]
MVVLILTAVPAGLRGHITRWLLEISPGVFVGHLPRRVRDELWRRVVELSRDGRAIMVESARNEQRLTFRIHRHDWEPVDLDGLQLMRRPTAPSDVVAGRSGWSKASRMRQASRRRNRS